MADFARMKVLADQIEALNLSRTIFKEVARETEEIIKLQERRLFAYRLGDDAIRMHIASLQGELNALRVAQELEEEASKKEPSLDLRPTNQPKVSKR